MDAITMLKDDHKTVEQLFKKYEKAGERAFTEKRQLVDSMIEALSTHAAIEEQIFYPVVRATVDDTDDEVLEALEEHHIVKWVLSELQTMPAEDERFDAKVTVLIENVRHHVEEEEQDLFPKVRDELGRGALNDLGDFLEQARKIGPTHPHPRSPDEPPANLIVGAAAGVADRIGDTVSGIAQGSVTAIGDIIATVTGRKKPKATPTGSSTARSTARRVRSTVSDATDAAIEATQQTKREGQEAVRRAKTTGKQAAAGTKRTAKAAKSAAKSTARTASSGAKRTSAAAKRTSKQTASTAKRTSKQTASSGKRRRKAA